MFICKLVKRIVFIKFAWTKRKILYVKIQTGLLFEYILNKFHKNVQ